MARAEPRVRALSTRTSKSRAQLPAFIPPELATLVRVAPADDGWMHEMKLDGYRILARKEGDSVRLFSRNGNDWTRSLPSLMKAVRALAVADAFLDGELVALREDGVSDFQKLQGALSHAGESSLVYYAFDILHRDGVDLRDEPLGARKAILREVLGEAKPAGRIRLSEHVVGNGLAFFEEACRHKLEGIISKRIDSPYRSARTRDWLKTKCTRRQEFVIGGFTKPSGSRRYFGALHLGVYEHGKLRYVGKVGTGFTGATLKDIHTRLTRHIVERPPFAEPPKGAEAARSEWVKPVLVGEVEFTERTKEGMLRHPTFRGLREDKAAREVVFEVEK